ncbi:MAG: hypothetical protein AAFU79_32455 [Myxococcota bacterium]
MDVLLLLALGGAAALVTAGGFAVGYVRKGRSHQQWQDALTEATALLPGARVSPGTRYDGPELRVDLDGHTVSIAVRGADTPDRGMALARVALPSSNSRVFIGWDDVEPPTDWAHVPEVNVEARADPSVFARSDDAALAQRVFDGARLDLIDVRREAEAHGVALSARGGYLELRFAGLRVSGHLLERLARATARVAEAWPEWEGSTRLGPG